jgi:excisionase family DNA binding protein
MEQYISVKQMAKNLNISLDTAYEYIHSENFPICRIGRTIRIPEDKLQKWLDKRTNLKGA